MTRSEIGEKFGITRDGARWHIRELVKKCGFSNKEEWIAAVISIKRIIPMPKEAQETLESIQIQNFSANAVRYASLRVAPIQTRFVHKKAFARVNRRRAFG